jgi:hypothetical protein
MLERAVNVHEVISGRESISQFLHETLPHTPNLRRYYLYSAVWRCGVRSDIYAIWKVVLAQAQSASHT